MGTSWRSIHLNLNPKSDYRRYPGIHEDASGLHLFGLILAEASRLEANDPTRLGASFTYTTVGRHELRICNGEN
jgi:hypothetical protein